MLGQDALGVHALGGSDIPLAGGSGAAGSIDGPHGPGWKLFGHHHPTWERKRRNPNEVEEDLLAVLEGPEPSVEEFQEGVAASIEAAKEDEDAALLRTLERVAALTKAELSAAATRAQVQAIFEEMQRAERERQDELEAFLMIARLS